MCARLTSAELAFVLTVPRTETDKFTRFGRALRYGLYRYNISLHTVARCKTLVIPFRKKKRKKKKNEKSKKKTNF